MYTDETKQLFNRAKYRQRRSVLRINQTKPEELLWQKLRHKQLGVKFRRQHGMGDYIVDFYCAKYSLVIEVHGDSHFNPDAQAYDNIRNNFLMSKGFTILRFTNQQIVEQMNDVLVKIVEKLGTPP